jgi:tetratricopeptide (TPR) repeat protein
MRFIYIPEDPLVWLIVGAIVLFGIGYAVFRSIWPATIDKLQSDDRYRQALAVYAGNLPQQEEPTRDDRRNAFVAAAAYLTTDHGIAAEEAERNLRLVVAQYDREVSYDLRHEALGYERAGAHQLALEYFERAARLQEEHDPKDYQFLQRCIARVRKKVQCGPGEG